MRRRIGGTYRYFRGGCCAGIERMRGTGEEGSEKMDPGEITELMNREKSEQFKDFLTQMIGQAIEQ